QIGVGQRDKRSRDIARGLLGDDCCWRGDGRTFHSIQYAPLNGVCGQRQEKFLRVSALCLAGRIADKAHAWSTEMTVDLAARRAWYAQDLALRAPIRRMPGVTKAFAAVPRERFLGLGPWRLLPDMNPDLPFITPDCDPAWVYHDVLVSIDV